MNDFHNKFDNYLREHNIDGAEDFLTKSIESAVKGNDTKALITALNEAIGFYRDLSRFEESKALAKSLRGLINNLDSSTRFISLINIGNSYRAANMLEDAISIFNEAIDIYNDNNLNMSSEYSACLNNLALALLHMNKHEDAIELFKEAFSLTTNQIKKATALVNIATAYLSLANLASAKNYLDRAKDVFENNRFDFHYMGYARAFGQYYSHVNDINKAIYYYEEALSSILMNVGRTSLYFETRDSYFKLLDIMSLPYHIKGIELAKSYYNRHKDDLFSKIDLRLHSKISIGLFGLGSECFGYDDLISEDHDFDQGFIILVNDDISANDYNQIKLAYNALDPFFKGHFRRNLDKKGVHYISKYLKDFLGYNDDNLSVLSKGLLTNGEIFYSGAFSSLKELRRSIIKNDRYSYFELIIRKTLEINQYIPYNINRAKERGENMTASLLKNHLIDRLIEYYYIYYNEYIPHDKLSIKAMKDGYIKEKIKYLLLNEIDMKFCEELSSRLIDNLFKLNLIEKKKTIYIEDYRYELLSFIDLFDEKKELVNNIVGLEWKLFTSTSNIGGKANCQSNKPYFKLMRESQYYVFPNELLKSYLADLIESSKEGLNLITLKYGYMERFTDPVHYKEIEWYLPKLSDKQISLIDMVSQVQLDMISEYSKDNKHITSRMRDISQDFDSLNNTSYETYLKGELSTYSEETLYLYSKMIANMALNNKNIVDIIIRYTNIFHVDEEN